MTTFPTSSPLLTDKANGGSDPYIKLETVLYTNGLQSQVRQCFDAVSSFQQAVSTATLQVQSQQRNLVLHLNTVNRESDRFLKKVQKIKQAIDNQELESKLLAEKQKRDKPYQEMYS